MKKICIYSLGVIASMGVLFTSCGGGVSTNPTLKNDVDSVSYALGANLYEGLNSHLVQLKVLGDTASLKMQYMYQIGQENDADKKATLEKEMKTKMDSLSRANTKNLAEFMRGLQEGIKAADAQDPYINGLATGRQISSRMIDGFKTEMYGNKADSITINKDMVLSGLTTALQQKKLAIENPSMFVQSKMNEARGARELEKAKEMQAVEAEQAAVSKKFLEENAQKEGVVTLPSGLQYKIVTEGKGAKAKATDEITAHYHGTTIDGTVFDSSVDRGTPATFNVSGVIKGWTEALQLMPVGSKWILYIPQDLAYGAQQAGTIKPFSTLIFEVELLEILK